MWSAGLCSAFPQAGWTQLGSGPAKLFPSPLRNYDALCSLRNLPQGQSVIYSDSELVFVAEAFFWVHTKDLSPPCWSRECRSEDSLATACLGVGEGAAVLVPECQRGKRQWGIFICEQLHNRHHSLWVTSVIYIHLLKENRFQSLCRQCACLLSLYLSRVILLLFTSK